MKTEKLILGALQTNCYIVFDSKSKEAAVIDPASNAERIIEKAKELNLEIKYIILTHAHCDHLCALDELRKFTNAKICIGKNEENALNKNELNLCIYFGENSPESKADITLSEGDILKLGEETIKIIFTPGHTKGGITLIYDNCAITGDTLFYESVGRSDFPTSSTRELMNSIKDKLFNLPDSTVVYPGHGESTTIGHEKTNNPFVW